MELNQGLKECWPRLLREGGTELARVVRRCLAWKVLERSEQTLLSLGEEVREVVLEFTAHEGEVGCSSRS